MQTGRPVLLVPKGTDATPTRHIAIGWDGELAAARALTAALPLLERAASVELLLADTIDAAKIGAGEAIAYLALHGVTARARTVGGATQPGAALLHAAEAADLLVMGAYGHSRIVERLFGGVTAYVVAHARQPVLMLH